MKSLTVSTLASLTFLAAVLFANQSEADTIHLTIDSNQSVATIAIAGESDSSAISGSARIDLQSPVQPFGTAQITALDATLDDGFEIDFLLGLVTLRAEPGDVMTMMASAGPAGNVDANDQFSQPGNTAVSSGTVFLDDPFNLVGLGGSQEFDLTSFGPAPFDFTDAQLSLNGDTLTLSSSFSITQEIAEGITFTLDVVVVATGIVPDVVPANSLIVFRGIQIGGTLADASNSDDFYLRFNPGFTLSSTEPPVWLVFESTLPDDSPAQLALKLEAGANTVGLSQTIEFFDFDIGSYQEVDVRMATMSDSIVEVITEGDVGRYVQSGSGTVRARIGWKVTGPVLVYPWQINLDQLVWLVVP